ncbi:MAG: hypothetical protein AAGF97_02095 [Planctomycetota bacterium]
MKPSIPQQLDSLRSRIRTYVWCEGLAVALAWLGLTFWIGLALDYLPVRLGGTEMPMGPRLILLLVIAVVLLIIGYRWIARRAFVPLSDASLALLLEKTHPELADSLVTTVELADDVQATDVSTTQRSLYSQTVEGAARQMGDLHLHRVFNRRPLMRATLAAGLLVLSVVGFAFASQESFALWCKRLYGLSAEAYPRQTRLEMVGWENGITIPRGSDLTLRVRADANRSVPPPEVCTVYFKTAGDERGRVNMSRVGQPRDGYQYYLYEGKPFKGVLNDIRFDVVGNDFRLKDQHVEVAERPQIVQLDVGLTLPDYTGLLPRQEAYRPGMQIPQGSEIVIRGRASKPLSRVVVEDPQLDDPQLHDLTLGGDTEFVYAIPAAMESLLHQISLWDEQQIGNDKPYRLDLAVLPDLPPQINSQLVGIGSAVTVDARIPIEGKLEDDFGIDRAWTSLVVESAQPKEIVVVPDAEGEINATVDLRELRRADVELAVDSRITLTVMALDKCDLGAGAHLGQGNSVELEVVTPNQLMALLEARELGLRKRLEQIIDEARETRDSLARVQTDLTANGDAGAPTEDNDEDRQADLVERVASGESISDRDRELALRLLRVQRGKQQVDRMASEVMGIALSFDDIRLELINNRVDSAERQNRIERDIARPLRRLSEGPIVELSRRLQTLEGQLGSPEEAELLKRAALGELDEVILSMERVLEKMLDLETFSELIDLVNSLIRDQEALLEQTKKERKKRALDLLK